MTKHTYVEDAIERLRTSRAATEEDAPVAPTAAVLDASGRTRAAGRGGIPAVARAIDGLHATAGNGAVAWLLGGGTAAHRQRAGAPSVRAAHAAVVDRPAVQRDDGDDEETAEAAPGPATDDAGAQALAGGASGAQGETTGEMTGGEAALPLGGGAPTPGPSWTKVGPPTPASYSVSGSLRTVANAVAARTEAGSVTTKPDAVTEEWEPPGGTSKVTAARITVDQVLELPVWSDKSNATKNQQAEWDRFHGAITTHEDGHVGKDKTAFAGAHSKMVGQTPSDANTNLDAVEAKAKTDNTTYDAGNHHGIDQGTGINPNIDEVTKVP